MTRKKTKSKAGGDTAASSSSPSSGSGPTSSVATSSSSGSSDDTEHHPEDEYIVPQIVKVVSLADHQNCYNNQNLYSNGGSSSSSRGGGVTSTNNILLVDHPDSGDPTHPPPSFLDNCAPEPENILGLSYHGDPDGDDDDDDLNDEFSHKFASFTLSTPCASSSSSGLAASSVSDERVDFFSTVTATAPGRYQPFTITTHSSSIGSPSNTISTSSSPLRRPSNPVPPPKITSTSRIGGARPGDDFDCDVDDWENCCGTVPCITIWEELRFCEGHDCNSPANRKCAQCKNVFYCSPEHHRLDWKRHRVNCTPFRIQFVGMGAADEMPVSAAVACRNIAAGQVIFNEKPMLVFPLADSQTENQLRSPLDLPCIQARIRGKASERQSFCDASFPACLGCVKIGNELDNGDASTPHGCSCSNCGLPLCSYNCQLLIAHQVGECDAIASAKLEPTESTWFHCAHAFYMDIEIMRALQLEKYDRPGWELLLEQRTYVRVEHYKNTPSYHLFASNMETLVPFSVKISGYNYDLIGDVHAIINSLSYRPNLNCTYKLLFSTQSQFAHDCVPNTLQYVEEEYGGDGKRMRLVTKAAIPIMKGEVITLDFTPSPYLSYQRRRQVLDDVLNISSCMCQRCQHPSVMNDLTTEIKCYSCRMGTVCSENYPLWKESVWSCRICQEEISFYRIQEIERDCASELSLLVTSASNTGSVREVQDWIRRKGQLDLNPKHHLIFTAWCYCESLIRSRISRIRNPDPAHVYTAEEMEHFDTLGKYSDLILEHLDSIRPGIWIDKGIAQFHKFYSSFALTSRHYQNGTMSKFEFVKNVMKALKILQQALQTLSVYEGYNSPSVLRLTHEVTSVLSSLKEYMAHFLQLSESETYPLPSLEKVLNSRSHV